MTDPALARLTVPDLLAARLEQEPDRVAVILDGERSLTLADWDVRSNAVAHRLIDRGVRPEDRVGLLFGGPQWIEYLVAYMGVLKAGAVAVPLSNRLSVGQVRFRLGLSGASLVVHPAEVTPPELDVPTAMLEDLDRGDIGPVDVVVRPDDLAEILFTSGTTGDSKGVSATHANITYGQQRHPAERRYAGSRHLLCGFPIGTAAAQLMIIFALVAEPTLVIASRFETESFARIIESYQVETMIVVPAMAIDLVNARVADRYDLSSVVHLGCGGAALAPRMASELARMFPNAEVVNYYASTEITPILFTMPFVGQHTGSVGQAPDGVEVLVADEDGTPQPRGEVGEVWVRSAAPTRAYYRDQQATERTFGAGWIRTGDFGYLDEQGYLFLVDRDQDVIKVGGLKVSTLQVEAALFEHPAIADAAVVDIPHPVMGRMVAAAVRLSTPVDLTELRAFLRERLAEYELPTRIMVVDDLPRNAMGKVLKWAVRQMFDAPAPSAAPRIAPSSPIEVAVGRLWTEVLGGAEPSVDDDFFALGGDSLSATRLASRMSATFGVDMPVSQVFDVPVLAQQAEWVASRATVTRTTTQPQPSAGGARPGSGPGGSGERRIPLSPFQERHLKYVSRGSVPPPTLPALCAVRVTEPLEIDVFRRVLEEMVGRQESLRTYFVSSGDGQYEAVVRDELDPHLTVTEVDGDTPEERLRRALRVAQRFAARPFRIVGGELFRALVIRLAADDHVVVLAMDHLVSDMLSMDVLQRDIGTVYTAFRAGLPSPLPPLPLQASEFFGWVRDQFPRNRPYWRRTLAGAPSAAGPLPGQRLHTSVQDNRGLEFDLPADPVERLRATYRGHGVTLFMAGMAVWSAVLSSRTGAPEVVLTSPMSGRTRPEAELLVGSILQSPYLRMRTDDDPSFAELFARARRTVVEAAEHQFFAHHEFIHQVPYPARFSVDDLRRVASLPGLSCEPFPLRPNLLSRQTVLGDVDLNVPRMRIIAEPDGRLRGMLSYNANVFDRPLVQALVRDFVRYLDEALEHPERRLSELT